MELHHFSHRDRLAPSLLLLCFCVWGTTSWWMQGHLLVSQVAKSYLKGQRENGTVVVDVVDAYAQLFSTTMAYFPLSGEMVTAAYWMDDMRSFGWTAFDQWHYINSPFDPDNVTIPCAPQVNVVSMLKSAYGTLKSSRSVTWGDAVMTRVVLHLVGDIHQPMHTCTLFDSQFPDGDRGGNSFKMKVNGSSTNLHAFWDSAGGLYQKTYGRPLSSESRSELESIADELMMLNPPSSFNVSLTDIDFDLWQADGYRVGVSKAYLDGKLEYDAEVSDEYISSAQAVSKRQIALAGYRLAHLLESVMDPFVVPSIEACQGTGGDDDEDLGSVEVGWVIGIAFLTSGVSFIAGGLVFAIAVGVYTKSLSKRLGYQSLGGNDAVSGHSE